MSFLNRFKDFWYIWSRHVLPVAYWIAYKPRGLGFRLRRWWENTTVACGFHGWVFQIKHKLVNFKITTGFGSEQSACYCGGVYNGSLQYLESIPSQIAKRGGIDLPVWNSLVGRRFLSLDSLVETETGILFNQGYSAIISSQQQPPRWSNKAGLWLASNWRSRRAKRKVETWSIICGEWVETGRIV